MFHFRQNLVWTLAGLTLVLAGIEIRVMGQERSPALGYLAQLAAANSALRLNEASEARRWLDQIPEAARAWEWQLLNARVDSSVRKLTQVAWTPVRLDASSDGKRLAVACSDGYVRIYHAQSLELIAEWQVANQAVYAARFNPLRDQIAVCSRDGQISLWEIASQEKLWSQKSGGEGLADIAFRPDGQQLLFCSWFRGPKTVQGTVSTWDVTNGHQTWTTEFGVKPVVTARYSPDGKQFAVGTWDAVVGVWKTDAVDPLREPHVFDFADRPQYSAIDDIAFSPDGRHLAAATKNGTPRIWQLDQPSAYVDMIGNSSAVFSIAFAPDGRSLLTGGSDGVLAVWDIAKRVQTHRCYGHSGRIVSIATTPDSGHAITAAADNSVRAWDLSATEGFESSQAAKSVYGMVLADDGRTLVTAGQSDTTITAWDVQSRQALRHFAGTNGTVNFLDGDGKNCVAGGNWNGDICIWDVQSGQIVKQMGTKELGGMQQCALSDDQAWLASATNKKQVVVWNPKTGEVVKVIPIPEGCWGIDFAHDNSALAVGDGKGNIHWISTTTWETVWICNAGTNQVYAIRISNTGEWLAAGTEGGILTLIDIPKRAVKYQAQAHSERIWTLDISADNQRLATGSADRKVKTWDPKSGESILTISDFTDPIYNLRFSPDSKSLFVNSLGSGIKRLSTP